MATKEKLRNIILKKVENLSEDKLQNLESFLNDLESHFSTERSPLSYSGIFREIDLSDLTTQLHENRADNNDRIPSF